jgi:uncharacterized protein
MLRAVWKRIFKEAWILSLILFLILAGIRAYGILGGSKSNNIPVALGFVIMWSLPLIILTKEGRRQIGIRKPKNVLWIILSPLLGAATAFVVFLIGFLLYGHSCNNWYVTVGRSYFGETSLSNMPFMTMFIFCTIPAVLFSPLGEELFFRGIVHESVKMKWNTKTGVIVNSSLFGIVHILHHGLSNSGGSLQMLWVSGSIWVVLMFLSSNLFTLIREKTESIWPAVIAHVFFSLTMNITIFFILFKV